MAGKYCEKSGEKYGGTHGAEYDCGARMR